VHALRAPEFATAYDVDSKDVADAARTAALRLVTASLCIDGEPAFACTTEAAGLSEDELLQLTRAVDTGLEIVSPLYGRVDATRWEERLREGALSVSNSNTAILMAECADISVGWGGVVRQHRPDRYYGKPVVELTDAQLMAFRAACTLVDSARPSDQK
jgi:hypothetical protein